MHRIGHGYDLHRLEPLPPEGRGKPLVLGGVAFPGAARGVVAHSDGDALIHAVTDALLGAIGAPDIGQLFPDSDPANAGRDSREMLRDAAERVARAGLEVASLDATLILESPRIAPKKAAIRASIAGLLGVDEDRVNVKGKTHEGVDAVGRGEAVEAHAVVLLRARSG